MKPARQRIKSLRRNAVASEKIMQTIRDILNKEKVVHKPSIQQGQRMIGRTS